jgi:hypothetical protein
MARDLMHNLIREVLINEGWEITHDPFVLKDYDPEWEIDFGAEKIIAAERGTEKIAVEAKSYLGLSFAYEFHQILGQHLNYKAGLNRIYPDRILYLAVPKDVYEIEFSRKGIANSIDDYHLRYFVFNEQSKTITLWNH